MTSIPSIQDLGSVPGWDGIPQPVLRSHDGFDLSALDRQLLPDGVRELENRIAAYWTDLARWRAGRLNLASTGIDLDSCRETLAAWSDVGDPNDFTSINWHEVGLRAVALRRIPGGCAELFRLHELLTSDDPNTGELPR